jgi:hypothetical protein
MLTEPQFTQLPLQIDSLVSRSLGSNGCSFSAEEYSIRSYLRYRAKVTGFPKY